MSPVLTLINTFKPLNSQVIELAQGHSDSKRHTCTMGSRPEGQYSLPLYTWVLCGKLSLHSSPFLTCQILTGPLRLNSRATSSMNLLIVLHPLPHQGWASLPWASPLPTFPEVSSSPYPLISHTRLQASPERWRAWVSPWDSQHWNDEWHMPHATNACWKLSGNPSSLIWPTAWWMTSSNQQERLLIMSNAIFSTLQELILSLGLQWDK